MIEKFRIVCDTNTIISAALFQNSVPRQVMDSIKKDSILLSSTEVIEELKDVLMRAKFDKYLSRQKRIEFIKSFFNDTEFFAPLSKITDCSDPKDNKFLELAIDGKATDIISGDSDLLEMNPYRGIKILMAADFLKELP